MVKRKKIYLGFLRDRLRWLAFPHNLASVPLADVEYYTRRVFMRSLALDDIVVMLIAAVPSSFGIFLGLVPASFGSSVVDRAANRSLEQIYGGLTFEREVGIVAAIAGQLNLVCRPNCEFCSASEKSKCILTDLFRMSLNKSNDMLSKLSSVCRRDRSSDDRFDKCDVFHRTNIIGLNKVSWISPPLSESHPADINCHRVDPPS